ncbi:DUF6221 family protein [Pseudonocardia dioxanivorans]|uniref:DUF6221 family protein n=1 Tax=Pseudonocardia dioxanivorans TaxID=240495 RepID=UPI001930BFA2|nr:DUF6221 family protein [Pseudonocardia dioxanivorans]
MSEPSLVEWLSARLDEDERDDREAIDRFVSLYGADGLVIEIVGAPRGVLARAKRGLAEVEAKRRIIALHEHQDATAPSRDVRKRQPQQDFGCITCADWDGMTAAEGWCDTVRLLALPYADRPGYRDEWRPQ